MTTTETATPFFTNQAGQHQSGVYHSQLARHRDLMMKFRNRPFESQYPRTGTPGLVVSFQVPDDDHDYLLTIENDAIAKQLEAVDLEQWHRVTATGSREEAALEIYTVAPFELDEGEPPASPAAPATPATPAPEQPPAVTVEAPKVTQTHVEAVAMTLEVVCAFEGTSVVLDAGAVSRIYNTHFIALSRTRGGLVR